MKTFTVTISYNAMNSQGDDLASQEITETINGLINSLRTQVNDVQFDVKTKDKN